MDEKVSVGQKLHVYLHSGFLFVCFLFFLAAPCGLWDLSSLIRDGTSAVKV